LKRDPALVGLSHDHHQALFVAQRLRRAAGDSAVREAREAFLRYWDEHGAAHFRAEEEVLLPAYAGHGDAHHPLVSRALCEHVAIRHLAAQLRAEAAPAPEQLDALGIALADHVRLEERELFPMIESALPVEDLAAVGAALERAERHADHG
jgi:hemerythrin-like domain-containing protein